MDRSIRKNAQVIVENRKAGRPTNFDTFDKDIVRRSIGKMMIDKQYVTDRTLVSLKKVIMTWICRKLLFGDW